MFGKKHIVRIGNSPETAVALATAWGIIEHRPFAKYRVTQNFTTFWLTSKEKKALEDIIKLTENL